MKLPNSKKMISYIFDRANNLGTNQKYFYISEDTNDNTRKLLERKGMTYPEAWNKSSYLLKNFIKKW